MREMKVMKNFLKFGITGLVASILLGSSTLWAADFNVGVFDFWKVWRNDPQVTQMQAELKKRFGARQKKILALREMIINQKKHLNEKSVLEATSSQKMHDDMLNKRKKLSDMQTRLREEFLKARDKSLGTIYTNIRKAVQQIAKDKNLKLVFNRNFVAYNEKSLDITDAVIKALKAQTAQLTNHNKS
jgi:Skp family chaperone for outer membrane proteins